MRCLIYKVESVANPVAIRAASSDPPPLITMSVKPTSLALLVCDTPIPKVRTAHGEYPAIFTEFFQRSLPGGGGDTESVPKFTMDAYDVVHKQEYPDEARLGEYDAIVLTGSGG